MPLLLLLLLALRRRSALFLALGVYFGAADRLLHLCLFHLLSPRGCLPLLLLPLRDSLALALLLFRALLLLLLSGLLLRRLARIAVDLVLLQAGLLASFWTFAALSRTALRWRSFSSFSAFFLASSRYMADENSSGARS